MKTENDRQGLGGQKGAAGRVGVTGRHDSAASLAATCSLTTGNAEAQSAGTRDASTPTSQPYPHHVHKLKDKDPARLI